MAPQSLLVQGLLSTSDQSDVQTSARQHNTRKRQASMPPAGFEPAVPVRERRQAHVFNRAATGIGVYDDAGAYFICLT